MQSHNYQGGGYGNRPRFDGRNYRGPNDGGSQQSHNAPPPFHPRFMGTPMRQTSSQQNYIPPTMNQQWNHCGSPTDRMQNPYSPRFSPRPPHQSPRQRLPPNSMAYFVATAAASGALNSGPPPTPYHQPSPTAYNQNSPFFSPTNNCGVGVSMRYRTPDFVNNSGVGASVYYSALSRASKSGNSWSPNNSSQSQRDGTLDSGIRKRKIFQKASANWKERCTDDPWAGILPRQTPGEGERLATDAAKQRHTVLFTPKPPKVDTPV